MSGCIEHGLEAKRYGSKRIQVDGVYVTTTYSRAVFYAEYGYLPEVVMHTCDNPRCINPSHLMAGTHKSNAEDKVNKGRWRGGRPRLPESLRQAVLQSEGSQTEVAKRFNISQITVSRIRREGIKHG